MTITAAPTRPTLDDLDDLHAGSKTDHAEVLSYFGPTPIDLLEVEERSGLGRRVLSPYVHNLIQGRVRVRAVYSTAPAQEPAPTTKWQLQQFDTTWGGWRPVPKAFDDDSPAEFLTHGVARDAMRKRARATRVHLRVVQAMR